MKRPRGGENKFCFGYVEFQVHDKDIQQAEESGRLDMWNWNLSVSKERVINPLKYIFHKG